jgi:hypothetical protein
MSKGFSLLFLNCSILLYTTSARNSYAYRVDEIALCCVG